jgi:hypothetical protein
MEQVLLPFAGFDDPSGKVVEAGGVRASLLEVVRRSNRTQGAPPLFVAGSLADPWVSTAREAAPDGCFRGPWSAPGMSPAAQESYTLLISGSRLARGAGDLAVDRGRLL